MIPAASRAVFIFFKPSRVMKGSKWQLIPTVEDGKAVKELKWRKSAVRGGRKGEGDARDDGGECKREVKVLGGRGEGYIGEGRKSGRKEGGMKGDRRRVFERLARGKTTVW